MEEKTKKRIRTLLIPYIIWNVIPILFNISFIIGGAIIHNKPTYELSDNIMLIFSLHNYWDINRDGNLIAPQNFPLWFLRDLIVQVIISPLLFVFIKYTKNMGVLLFLLYYFFGFNFISVPGINIYAMTFFIFGAYFALERKNILEQLSRYSYYIYPVCIISLLIAVYTPESGILIWQYSFRLYIITGVCSLFSFSGYLCSKYKMSLFNSLTHSTFFIYAAHLGLSITRFSDKIVWNFFNFIPFFINYILVPFVAVLICVMAYSILHKLLPRFTLFICGR